MSIAEYFDRVRMDWLDREGWKPEQIERLYKVFGIEANELRQRYK